MIQYGCHHAHPSEYSLLNRRPLQIGDDGVIRWHIVNFTPDMDKHKVIRAIDLSMQTWQAAFDLVPPKGRYIKLESTKYFDQADITIFFAAADHEHTIFEINTTAGAQHMQLNCPHPFDAEQGILAHAWPLNAHSFPGQVHMDEAEHWADMHRLDVHGDYIKMYVHLQTVLFHELGHVFGLGHSEYEEAIMHASYTGVKTEMHSDDQEGLNYRWRDEKLRVAKMQGYVAKRKGLCGWWR